MFEPNEISHPFRSRAITLMAKYQIIFINYSYASGCYFDTFSATLSHFLLCCLFEFVTFLFRFFHNFLSLAVRFQFKQLVWENYPRN